jgi:hypothetical protein
MAGRVVYTLDEEDGLRRKAPDSSLLRLSPNELAALLE